MGDDDHSSGGTTMTAARSARLHKVGDAPSLDTTTPQEPGEGEVLVELDHAGVNPLDTYVIAGQVGGPELPRIIGVEGTGMVDGHRVVVHGSGVGLTRDGTWTSTAVVPKSSVFELTEDVDPVQAAGLAVAGVTAWRVVRELAHVDPLDRVLVLAAGGGVGSIIVQLAKAAGAVVWAQTGSESKREAIAGLGADNVVVATASDLVAAAMPLAPTVVFDPLGGYFLNAAVEVLEPAGRLVTYGTSAGGEAMINARAFYRKGLRALGYGGMLESVSRTAEGIGKMAEEVASGRVTMPVAEVLPLDRFADAVDLVKGRKAIGKVVLALR